MKRFDEWHVGMGNGEGYVFADEGRMRMGTGGTTLTPICHVYDFDGELDDHLALIAKAPSMYAALMDLLDAFGNEKHDTQQQSAIQRAKDIFVAIDPDSQYAK